MLFIFHSRSETFQARILAYVPLLETLTKEPGNLDSRPGSNITYLCGLGLQHVHGREVLDNMRWLLWDFTDQIQLQLSFFLGNGYKKLLIFYKNAVQQELC